MIPPELPDWREDRDWKRIWRDPPRGQGIWCCCGGGCTPGCASPGSSGADTGGLCTDCGTQIYLDAGPIAHGGGVTVLKSFAPPSPSGLCIEVRCKVAVIGGSGVMGIFLGDGRVFFARPAFSNYGIQSCVNNSGVVQVGSTFTTVGALGAGDTIAFIIKDASSGAGAYTVCYLINGATVRVETGVTACFPNPVNAGIIDNSNAAFTNFEVRTN